MFRVLFSLLIVISFAPEAVYALGERFKVETTGTEYCGDFDVSKLSAANNVDLWVEVVSESELTVSTTSDFQPGTTFQLVGVAYLVKSTSASFAASQSFANGGYLTVQGFAKASPRTGEIASLSGTFIQHNMFDDNCFSSGKFKSVQRTL